MTLICQQSLTSGAYLLHSKIYWDSNAFLALLQNESGRVDACRDTLEAAQTGDFLIVTSALTLAEVLWLKGGPRLPEEKADLLNRFFRRSSLRVVNLDRRIAQVAQRLVWENGIKPKDSIHLASALHFECSILETFDRPFISKSADFESIEIREPQSSPQSSFDV